MSWIRKVCFLAVFLSNICLSVNSNKIKHVIVLMLENRSFDHMLGMLKKTNPNVNGCLPDQSGCSNHVNPADVSSPTVTVDDTAVYSQMDPHHSVSGTSKQIYGVDGNTVATMDGFIASYSDEFPDKDGTSIMKCFSPEHVPAITTLATEFAMFDGYFASIPGPTEPNRAYAISATSHGMATNDEVLMVKGMPQKTIFRQIEEMGLDYRLYIEQVPACLMFKDLRHKDARPRYRRLTALFEDLAAGDMPEYSWIEPTYFDVPEINVQAADQHPDHDVSVGDQLIKDIYEAVRASPLWNETAFIITYDEHGGFFDHVVPAENIPNPDGLNDEGENFNFDRQGIRVPFIVVSPWVKKGTVVHAAPAGEGQYEHSSIVATVVHKLFKPMVKAPFLQPDYLTERDAWAKTFEDVFETNIHDNKPTLRTDCPMKLPEVPRHRTLFPNSSTYGAPTMTDFQTNLVMMMAGATDDIAVLDNLKKVETWSEAQGGSYVTKKMEEFLNQK